MRIVEEPFPTRITEGSVVSIGKFDGVHVGHRVLLAKVVARAKELGIDSAVLTFDRNPREVIRPGSAPPIVHDLPARLALIAESGIDLAAVIRFDAARAAQTAEEFTRDMLRGRLQAREVFVGEDFRFGRMGHGDVALLTELGRTHGFTVVAVPLIGTAGEEKVSSTRIRELILAGEVRAAGELLGAAPSVVGEVVHGEARGRELGFPTANLGGQTLGLIPGDGVYAGWATIDGVRHPAAISVSDNPTFGDVAERRVEAHLLDVALDLYGRRMEVEFVDRLRGSARFDSVEHLISAMHEDVRRTRVTLGLPEAR